MLIDAIEQARVPGQAAPCRLRLDEGRVLAVEPSGSNRSESARGQARLLAAGKVVLPAFVDAHVHIDKAFLLGAAEAEGPFGRSLEAAIARVGKLRESVAFEQVQANAERALGRLIRHGVTAARAHVELDVSVGLRLVELHLALARSQAHRIALELVAFPQRGLELPGMTELMRAAMALGLPVVGGCPYVDRDPTRHLDFVFELAERHQAPVDLHLDFSDDPGRSLLDLVIERTRAHGMAGRVTIGHVTTLAAMPPDAQNAALDGLAAAGIALVVLPATDLYLAGHGEPGTRSLAPFERARAAGVSVAIANNNLHNPFAPFGNGNLLAAAWLAGITRRAAGPRDRAVLLEAITSAPATILGLPLHGPYRSAHAHLALLDAEDLDHVLLEAPAVLCTLRAGKLVYRLEPPACVNVT